MANNDKKKNKQTDQSKPQQSSQPAMPAPAMEGRHWTEWVAFVLSLIALVVAGLSAYYSWQQAGAAKEQTELAKQTLLRATGRIAPALDVIDATSNEQLVAKSSFVGTLPLLKTFDDLARLHPQIVVKNSGKEPIESVRVECRFRHGAIDARDVPLADMQLPGGLVSPWVFSDCERDEYSLSKPLPPGQYAIIPIGKLAMPLMLQSHNPKLKDREHLIGFELTCYARLVGAPNWETSNQGMASLKFSWIPSGFPEAKCREYMASRPIPEIVETYDESKARKPSER